MLHKAILVTAFVLAAVFSFGQEHAERVYFLHKGKINKETALRKKVKEQNSEKTGVALRDPVKGDGTERPADVVMELIVPEPGTYVLTAEAYPIDPEKLKKEDTTGMRTLKGGFKLGASRPTERIVYDTFRGSKQELGKFEFSNTREKLNIWLPGNLVFCTLSLTPYAAPVAPPEAENYKPTVLPSSGRPRLWVNQESLPTVRKRLQAAEHKDAWEKVKANALKPYHFDFNIDRELFYDEKLEQAIEQKAFFYLVTEDRTVGEEAVDLAAKYLSVLEFGNVSYGDITRELGRAIYTGALVYDWCYDLMDGDTKASMRKDFRRLVRDMEIGWPPFYGVESIVNGHGNEAQICRDMLSWSLAVYDEDPEPYKYVSYTILEQLVPMRKFEYQSPRHNQGVDYGAYRFGWEMHAVWLYYRMLGYPVFDDNIKNLPYYWLYMRLPDGYMLRDGDMFSVKNQGSQPIYWKQPQTMLLCYAYANDPLLKGEFERQGGLPDNPVLFLLLDDPALKAKSDLSGLPLTKDFGPVLGGMIARTGWDIDSTSNDVVAEIKGGGYHFGNHQHADAGALQLFYRGMQVGDLGLYLSYGPPYDFEFNKRSISHSMMLLHDPDEELRFRTRFRDGGSRFSQRFPRTPEEARTDRWFDYGSVISSDFGPSLLHPAYSYFDVDLTAAYSEKMVSYRRSFCFLDLDRTDVPAVVILADDMESADPDFKKYWQINTLNLPEQTAEGIVLHNKLAGKVGKTYVDMLVPRAADRTTTVLSGAKANSTFGQEFEVRSNRPEANGHRILVSPKAAQTRDHFLTVFQVVDGGAEPLPIGFEEQDGRYQLTVADRVVSMRADGGNTVGQFTVSVAGTGGKQVLLAGLNPGFWQLTNAQGAVVVVHDVKPGKNTLAAELPAGIYTVSPGRSRLREN
ncbi:hypothetical protein [Parapedobacter defluvii]|uniref:hypothetical protein n=1 Tax=Parapedobacter defluvii TaxID=2045106 RepID=UPI00333E7A78